jgi:hypothetical protein
MNHDILFIIIPAILAMGASKNWLDKLKNEVFLTFFVGMFLLGMIMTSMNTAHFEKYLGLIELSSVVKNRNCFDDECDPPTKPPRI